LIAKDVETLETTRAETTRVSGFDHVSGLDLNMPKTYSLVDASIPHYIPHKAFSTQGGAFLQRRNRFMIPKEDEKEFFEHTLVF
jgi:hypothetical protein